MKTKHLCAVLSSLYMANAAIAAVSPEMQIIAPPAGENADWGQIHATSVTFKWIWPSGTTSALLTVVANGKSTVLSQELSDTTVSSFSWNCGAPTEDTVYDITLAFDNNENMTAQLYSLLGSFSGAPLRAIKATGAVKVNQGDAIAYRASWERELAGPATFTLAGGSIELPYSSGYFPLNGRVVGGCLAKLGFETEPVSPAFSCVMSGRTGLTLVVK